MRGPDVAPAHPAFASRAAATGGVPGPRFVLVVSSLLLALAAGSVSAQEIRGRVMEVVSEAPLGSAVVTAIDADSTVVGLALSDSAGAFALTVPEDVTGRVRVERLGYTTVETVVLELGSLEAVPLEVRLRPQPIELEGVTGVARLELNRNVKGFLRRERTGFGAYMGPAEIAEIRPTTATNMLTRVPAGFVAPSPSGRGILIMTPWMRHGNQRSRNPRDRAIPGYCDPTVYVDGALLDEGGSRLDAWVPAVSIRAVEVYRNPRQAPPYFQRSYFVDDPDCAIVLIWTDYGFGLGEWSGGR